MDDVWSDARVTWRLQLHALSRNEIINVDKGEWTTCEDGMSWQMTAYERSVFAVHIETRLPLSCGCRVPQVCLRVWQHDSTHPVRTRRSDVGHALHQMLFVDTLPDGIDGCAREYLLRFQVVSAALQHRDTREWCTLPLEPGASIKGLGHRHSSKDHGHVSRATP